MSEPTDWLAKLSVRELCGELICHDLTNFSTCDIRKEIERRCALAAPPAPVDVPADVLRAMERRLGLNGAVYAGPTRPDGSFEVWDDEVDSFTMARYVRDLASGKLQ